jgi:hypothetical protein
LLRVPAIDGAADVTGGDARRLTPILRQNGHILIERVPGVRID